MNTIPANLPESVAEYFATSNRFDADSAAACFTPDATVHDEGKTHVGIAQIRHWIASASEAYQPQATVLRARHEGDQLAVSVQVTGQFPQSPIELDFDFTLRAGKIAALTVH